MQSFLYKYTLIKAETAGFILSLFFDTQKVHSIFSEIFTFLSIRIPKSFRG